MPFLADSVLVDAKVPHTASFREAARVLAEHEVSAIAVLDDERKVVGMFSDDELLRGLFPAYLGELKHTAFVELDADALAAHLGRHGADPITEHMREPMTVERDAGTAHVVERFLHCAWGALAVVEEDRFVGMLGQVEFCRSIMRRLSA